MRFGSLAQSVEQRTVNPCVAGSSPAGAVKNSVLCTEFFFILNPSDDFLEKFRETKKTYAGCVGRSWRLASERKAKPEQPVFGTFFSQTKKIFF